MSLYNSPSPATLRKDHVFLVVDDFDTMRRAIAHQLNVLGAEKVISVRNGMEALQLLQREHVDMVLSDWNMPVMNGLELLQNMRADARLARIPFIMVTAEAERSKVEKAIASGVTTLLLKPYSPPKLLERIQIAYAARPRVSRAPPPRGAAPDTATPLPATESAAQAPTPDRPSILVVDDTPDNLTLLSELLKDEFRIQVCTTGAKALEICNGSAPPDLVLLDIMMPEMDGFEVAKHLSESPGTQHIPIIFVTAMEGVDARIKGLSLGAVDYVAKPINPDLLKPRVRNFMRYVQMRKDLQADYDHMVETAQLRQDVEHITRHDLRGPLAGVVALLQDLLSSDKLGPQEAAQLRLVEDTTYQIIQLVNLSNELYKIEAGQFALQPRAVDIGDLLGRLVDMACVTYSAKSLQCRLEINAPAGSDAPQAWGDAMLCYSVFENLIKNACEAAPEGSAIHVRALDQDPLRIVFSNQGAVPEPIRARFFEKYVTHGKEGGTGLGTYSAKLLTEAQHGTIALDVDAAANATTITVTLPRAGAAKS